ncbi:MAG: TetR/AcrR family transcriptional regulator [Kofleriaceae bacterium]
MKRRRAGRPAGGSEDLVRAILAATLAQLGERGLEGLSVEQVAIAANVNKTSIYRRWPTRAELVVAALADGAIPREVVETGDLRADLIRLLHAKARQVATPRGRRIALALLSIDEPAEAVATLRELRYRIPVAVLDQAVARGALPRGIDTAFYAELLYAPILQRALMLDESLGERYVERLVDHVLAMAAAAPVAS